MRKRGVCLQLCGGVQCGGFDYAETGGLLGHLSTRGALIVTTSLPTPSPVDRVCWYNSLPPRSSRATVIPMGVDHVASETSQPDADRVTDVTVRRGAGGRDSIPIFAPMGTRRSMNYSRPSGVGIRPPSPTCQRSTTTMNDSVGTARRRNSGHFLKSLIQQSRQHSRYRIRISWSA